MGVERTTLNDVLGQITDPFYSDNFELYIPALPQLLNSDMKGLQIQCKSLSIPGVANEAQDLMLHGFKVQVAGRTAFQNTLSVTFVENRNLNVYTTLRNWIYLVRDFRTQTSVGKSNFAVNAILYTYDETGKLTMPKGLTLYKFWCADVQDISLDNSQASVVDVSATFKFDYADESEQAKGTGRTQNKIEGASFLK